MAKMNKTKFLSDVEVTGDVNITGGDLKIDNKPLSDTINGATKYTNTDPMINDVGGIKASAHPNGFTDVSLNDLITEILYPYTKPTISTLTMTPATGANEKNVSLTVTKATVTITKKTKAIDSVALYRGSTLVQTKTQEDDNINITSAGTTVTFTLDETLDGSTNTSYSVKVKETGGDEISGSAVTYNFVYPFFYGVIPNGATVDSDTILGFTKEIRTKGNHGYSYTTENACPVIAYPKSYGKLSKIKDAKLNMEQTWPCYTVTVDNDGTINGVEYYVYVGGASTNEDFGYNFEY